MHTTVVLADDHPMVRSGIRRVIEKRAHCEVVGEAADGEQAVELILECEPDLAVLDIELPQLSGVEVIRKVQQAELSTRILVLSMHAGAAFVADALRAGAAGYLVKTANPDDICAAVDVVRKGGSYLSPEIASHVVGEMLAPGRRARRRNSLTPREREVLQLIANGLSGREIADRLGVSPKTVETHRWNVMKKLQIHKVTALVRYAIQEGLVQR